MSQRFKRLFGIGKIWPASILAAILCASTSQILPVAASESQTIGADMASGDVLKVRLGGSRTQTRLVMDLARNTIGQGLSRDTDTQTLVLGLSNLNVAKSLKGLGAGLVASWRLDNSANGVKLRLQFAGNAKVMRRFILPPSQGVGHYRYVIDIVSTEAANPKNSFDSPQSQTNTTSPIISELAAQSKPVFDSPLRKRIIVIDAGHGGKDPGAIGSHSNEKNINLFAARALRDKLEASGRYRVIMTRDTDSFVDLPARVRIARNANADLFISLHSDSGPNKTLRGASIYTLSDSGTQRAARNALAVGDWSHIEGGNNNMVNRILIDLTQRATKNRSAMFAQILLDRIQGTVPLLQTSNRQAGFAVLLATDVPAVLLEMGFVTNEVDENQLNDTGYRDRMMVQVVKAIDGYFEAEKRGVTMASLP